MHRRHDGHDHDDGARDHDHDEPRTHRATR
jgi:hypothetical protein